MRYVLIGNSAAGIGAVEGIRQVDAEGEITILSSEPHHTYSRPLISYLLLGRTTEEKMRYRGEDFYVKNKCTFLGGVTVEKIDPEQKRLTLSSGSSLSYDKLLVATGSSAFVPPLEGLDSVHSCHTFMSLSDACRLGAQLDRTKRVLILGAGLVGLKCAEGILDRAAQVTVVDLAPRILSSILDEGGARRVQRHLEAQGIRFRLCTGVKRFEGDVAILPDGCAIAFDVLVMAVGVRPNAALLKGIATIDKAIVIDERSKTTADGIFAAGDCTQSLDVSDKTQKIMALLPNAYRQGECAGINMAGGKAKFDNAIPMNAIGFFGLHIITAGNYTGSVYSEESKDAYKRLFYSDNRLNGYILIGNVKKAGIYTNLIREGTPLDRLDFPLVCERPGLMAFSREDRMVKLGGGVR